MKKFYVITEHVIDVAYDLEVAKKIALNLSRSDGWVEVHDAAEINIDDDYVHVNTPPLIAYNYGEVVNDPSHGLLQ